ncbi:MAG: 2Fe-2S iron-sulfur cluster-binding protein [Thermoanaerobaculia bacterium]
MPTVTIDGRTVEVEAGTNLIEAGEKVGVQIPHYCYHPRLSVVGQCRMCLVKVDGIPKLQAACSTLVVKDGMVVRVEDPEVKEAQEGVMEFLLINHPLDCPICDQAGECGLQDYSFKHGQAFSRFRFEEKRTYPGRERIPLGPHVLLNMNRCIQCTRCIRFTEEISKTGELGFFQRGARTEIGVFPGVQLDNPLSGCVVDVCPVGALTSTRFRFAERVWYLDKKPSICTGCDVGCNITLEHRGGVIRRYKPRFNPAVNDYWMCDFGRGSHERYERAERLSAPRRRGADGQPVGTSWKDALDTVYRHLRHAPEQRVAFLASGHLSTEEAFLLGQIAHSIGSPQQAVWVEEGPTRSIPTPDGDVTGREAAPNRRGAEMAGLKGAEGAPSADDFLHGEAASSCQVLVVADGDPGSAAHEPEVVERLRQARFLVVLGWAETPLSRCADVALPWATHAEKDGTFVNLQWRLQRFQRAFPPRGAARPGTEILTDLLARLDPRWNELSTSQIFRLFAENIGRSDLTLEGIPAQGVELLQASRSQEAGIPPPTAEASTAGEAPQP